MRRISKKKKKSWLSARITKRLIQPSALYIYYNRSKPNLAILILALSLFSIIGCYGVSLFLADLYTDRHGLSPLQDDRQPICNAIAIPAILDSDTPARYLFRILVAVSDAEIASRRRCFC